MYISQTNWYLKQTGTVNTEYLQLRPFNKDGQIAPLDYTKIARLCNNRINYHLNNPKGVIAVAFNKNRRDLQYSSK